MQNHGKSQLAEDGIFDPLDHPQSGIRQATGNGVQLLYFSGAETSATIKVLLDAGKEAARVCECFDGPVTFVCQTRQLSLNKSHITANEFALQLLFGLGRDA